ncbi:MAG: hypothetical protein ACRD1U_11225 [Vicinamibacterales bacterium]
METAEDVAKRLDLRARRRRERDAFIGSRSGVEAADASISELFDILTEKAASCSVAIERDNLSRLALSRDGYSVVLSWDSSSNTVDGCPLKVETFGPLRVYIGLAVSNLPQQIPPTPKSTELYGFDLTDTGEKGWRENTPGERFYSPRSLADECLRRLLLMIEEADA